MKKYLCIKNYAFYLKGNQYDFHFDSSPLRLQIFIDNHFISVKKVRKQKLEKLNEKISLY